MQILDELRHLVVNLCIKLNFFSYPYSCLGCICEASTRCDVFTGCVANGALCGPFLISKGFWIDSGRCVLEGDDPNSDQCNLSILSFPA